MNVWHCENRKDEPLKQMYCSTMIRIDSSCYTTKQKEEEESDNQLSEVYVHVIVTHTLHSLINE